jgi:Zn-dependent protease with chaperone function
MIDLSRLWRPYEWTTTVVQVEAGPHKVTQALPDGITASDLYNREITRRVPSTGKYVYLEREYGLSFSTVEEGAEITEQTRVSGIAYIVLLSLLAGMPIETVWLGSSLESTLLGFVPTLGGVIGLFSLFNSSRISTEDQKFTPDEQAGILTVHLLTVFLMIGCIAGVEMLDQLSLQGKLTGSILIIVTAGIVFTSIGQTFFQDIIHVVESPPRGLFIPGIYLVLVLLGVTPSVLMLEGNPLFDNTITAGAQIALAGSRDSIIFAAMSVIGPLIVLAPIYLATQLFSFATKNVEYFAEDIGEFSELQTIGIVALISLASITTFGAGIYYLIQLIGVVSRYEFASLGYFVLLATFTPLCFPLYFFTGGIYQLFGIVTGKALIRNSSSPPVLPYVPDADVRVLSTNSPIISAKRIRGQEMIVISEGLLQEIEQRTESELSSSPALAALLAHEEGHVIQGDTAIVSRLQLISRLTFAPKNVLYLIYNFRAREFDADDHAKKKVSPDALENALDLMENIDFDRTYMLPGAVGVAAAPIAQGASIINRAFGTLYGDFMLTEAHADFDDRRERLLN